MRNIHLYIFLFLLASLLLPGCKKAALVNENHAILFQVDYVNDVREYEHSGFFIDSEGNVYRYKNPANWIFPDKDFVLTESQIRDNTENCEADSIKIAIDELQKYSKYIKNITLSKVTAFKNAAAKTGSVKYICYQHIDGSEIYKGSILKMEGEYTCENLNFFTRKVTSWLKNFTDTVKKN